MPIKYWLHKCNIYSFVIVVASMYFNNTFKKTVLIGTQFIYFNDVSID